MGKEAINDLVDQYQRSFNMLYTVYVLRHTMHHHGQLAALSVHHGNEGGSWE